MRTVCPSCQAAYDVPDAVLAARRTLRCTRCGTTFTAAADGPPALPDGAVVAAVKPVAAEPDGRRPGDAVYLATPAKARPLAGVKPAILAAWAASFVVLIAMGWAFVAWRAPIMRAWPASARLYIVLRLA